MRKLLIDPRAGSRDYIYPLEKLGLPVKEERLEFGDVAFTGLGPGKRPVSVGVEIKSTQDMLGCISNGRFSGHQLIGLHGSYEKLWLLVVGNVKPGETKESPMLAFVNGKWVEPISARRANRDAMSYREYQAFLLTLEIKTRLHVRQVGGEREAAHWIAALFRWWTAKEFEQHRSHIDWNRSQDEKSDLKDHASLRRPSPVFLVASRIPGMGEKRAWAASKRFKSVISLVNATKEEWEDVEGVGETLAERAVMWVYGEMK